MAKNDNKTPKPNKNIVSLIGTIRDSLKDLYQKSFYTPASSRDDLINIKNQINNSLNNIQSNNIDNVGELNITNFYNRIMSAQGDKNVISSFKDIFENPTVMDSIIGDSHNVSMYQRAIDAEIDTILKYMPKLAEALSTKTDNVLTSDHFSKDFINIINKTDLTENDDPKFYKKLVDLKDIYKLEEKIEQWYDNAQKYGEEWVYHTPYKKALARLLKAKQDAVSNGFDKTHVSLNKLKESCTFISESGIMNFKEKLPKQVQILEGTKQRTLQLQEDDYAPFNNLTIELNTCGVLESSIREYEAMRNNKIAIAEACSLTEEAILDGKDLSYKKINDSTTSPDGLTDVEQDISKIEESLHVPGCVVKKLIRHNLQPIWIEDTFLGGYYFEFLNDNGRNILKTSTRFNGNDVNMNFSNTDVVNNDNLVRRDKMISYFAGQLSQYLDAKFINSNQDLRKEIYTILKQNDMYNVNNTIKGIRVTFIPPEHLEQIAFKLDPITHRGVSDLHNALLPAKLYSALYITNTIAIMTRGMDKRIYYVQQNIETNIAKTMLTILNNVKRSNFGIREVENLKRVLNITGRFNDHIIPKSPSGDTPINIEVLPGQNIEIKTELMTMLEEMAVNQTEVPLEMIQTRQNNIDYAIQLNMSSSKFLRKTYKRQRQYEKHCSRIITSIFNAEYNENVEIKVTLPPPMFLNITNKSQFIENTNNLAQSVTDMELAEEQDDLVKQLFLKFYKKSLTASYLDYDLIDKCVKKARQTAQILKEEQANQ